MSTNVLRALDKITITLSSASCTNRKLSRLVSTHTVNFESYFNYLIECM